MEPVRGSIWIKESTIKAPALVTKRDVYNNYTIQINKLHGALFEKLSP
jgi:hypothetical protein